MASVDLREKPCKAVELWKVAAHHKLATLQSVNRAISLQSVANRLIKDKRGTTTNGVWRGIDGTLAETKRTISIL